MKIFDRYSLLCFSVASILVLTVLVTDDKDDNENMIGIIHDISVTKNGYTFFLEDVSGKNIRCFTRSEPVNLSVCSVTGSYSDDGGIFFISRMVPLHSDI